MGILRIIKCNKFKDYVEIVVNNQRKYQYPFYCDSITENLLFNVLEKEQIEYSIDYKNLAIHQNSYLLNISEYVNMYNKEIKNNEEVVITFKNDYEYSCVAFHHAKMINRKLVFIDTFEDIINLVNFQNIKSFTIVCNYNKITIELLTNMMKFQREKYSTSNEFYFSFLTARNLEALINLIIRNDIYKFNRATKYTNVIRVDYLKDKVHINGDICIVPNKFSNLDVVKKEVYDSKNELVSFIGHGRDDLFWLNDGGICGRVCFDYDHKVENGVRRPSCAYTGKCFKEDLALIPASNIFAHHIFMNCCHSARTELCIFDQAYNIMFAILDTHAVSYLGSQFTIRGQKSLNYYYQALLLSGLALGEAAALVNRNYYDNGLGHESSFYLIGDSFLKLDKKAEIVTIELHDYDMQNNSYEHRYILETDTYLIRIRFSQKDLINDIYNFKKRVMVYSVSGQELYGNYYLNNDCTVLEIFSSDKIIASEILLKILSGPEFNLHTIENLQDFLILGVNMDNKFKSQLQVLTQNSLKLAKMDKQELWNLNNVYKNIYKKYDSVHEKAQELSELVIRYLVIKAHESGFAWDDQVAENGLVYDNKQLLNFDEVCPLCGGKAFVAKYTHNLYSKIKRNQHYCPSCGIIKECPENAEDIVIKFTGNGEVVAGEVLSETLVIKNNSKNIQYGYAGISIIWGITSGISYDKEYEKIEILPGECKEFKSNISFSPNTPPHNYWLRGNIILNGNIFSSKRDIWVSAK